MSWDGTTPGALFCPGIEQLQGSPSVLGWNDLRGVLLSWYGMTPGSQSWWNDSSGATLFWDGTTPEESFCPGIKRLQGSHSVLGWNDSPGVLPSI